MPTPIQILKNGGKLAERAKKKLEDSIFLISRTVIKELHTALEGKPISDLLKLANDPSIFFYADELERKINHFEEWLKSWN